MTEYVFVLWREDEVKVGRAGVLSNGAGERKYRMQQLGLSAA